MRFKFYFPRITECIVDGLKIRRRVSHDIFARCDGIFDMDSKGRVIFVFGKSHTFKSVIDTINHESLHWVLDKIEGYDVSQAFDKIIGFE
jgi:hypothetical protein